MQHRSLDFGRGFRVVAGKDSSEAAVMVLGPGETVGGPRNRHRDSDQWLYVTRGRGEAVVEGRRVDLSSGDLLLIERGEGHEIRAAGDRPLETLNFYVPPEYAHG